MLARTKSIFTSKQLSFSERKDWLQRKAENLLPHCCRHLTTHLNSAPQQRETKHGDNTPSPLLLACSAIKQGTHSLISTADCSAQRTQQFLCQRWADPQSRAMPPSNIALEARKIRETPEAFVLYWCEGIKDEEISCVDLLAFSPGDRRSIHWAHC